MNKQISLITLTFFLFISTSWSQGTQFIGTEVTSLAKKTNFNPQFTSFNIFELNSPMLYQHLKSPDFNNEINLNLGGIYNWDILLYENDITSPEYKVRIATEDGIEEYFPNEIITYYGYINGELDSDVRLTIKENFIYGFVRKGNDVFYIEPASRFQNDFSDSQYVVYDEKNVKSSGGSCAVTDVAQKTKEIENEQSAKLVGLCYRLELAIASDYSYYQDRGSNVDNVTAYTIGVMNNVANNYSLAGPNFDDGIEFYILEQFVSTCPSCDPWDASTDPSVLLSSFRSWANAGGFGYTNHDLGQLWTNRDFDGSTVGLASLDAVCKSFRYHVLQDYTSNAASLRVLTAHEIGHNFGINHDNSGTNFIMAPSVTITNNWSPNSISVASSNIANDYSGNCLDSCFMGIFGVNTKSVCEGSSVIFLNNSSAVATNWLWTLVGGTPATSTEKNPTIVYNASGVYNVTLTAFDINGTTLATETKTNYITVYDQPVTQCPINSTNANTSGNGFSFGISNVTLGNIDNSTPGTVGEGTIYTDNVCTEIVTLEPGTNYSLSVTTGPVNPEDIRAYIDFNNDGDFTDSGEQIYTVNNVTGVPTTNIFTTPAFPAEDVLLTLRVVSDWTGAQTPTSCETPLYGQVEDYGVYFEASGALPIELLSFEGNQQNQSILLNWKTSTELNNDYFTLEHSIDGNNFEFLTTLEGRGNSTVINDYRFIHDNPIVGTNYYRLSQTDIDGTREVVGVRAIGFKTNLIVATIFPNPVQKDRLNLKYISPKDGDIEIGIVDMTGKILIENTIQVNEGINNLELPIEGLSNGVYWLRTLQSETAKSIRFVKVE